MSRAYVLARRPVGRVEVDDFELVDTELPALPAAGLMLETLHISIDPAIRGWLDDRPSYLPPVGVGEPVRALGLARVVRSGNPAFPEGTVVRGFVGWQEHVVVTDTAGWQVVADASTSRLGVLGMTGLTAWVGMTDIGRPQRGDTVVVSGAAGAVGSVAAQLALIAGARVVGIAGGSAKGDLLRSLGVDEVVDYRSVDWRERLKAATPDGVDVNFENVGGDIMEAVIDRMNNRARMPLCGLTSGYNEVTRPGGPSNFGSLLTKRVRLEGLIVVDHFARAAECEAELSELVSAGRLRPLETVMHGFDAVAQAFVESFDGGHVGKLVVSL